jgi:lysophospholipase L1-like esterase
MRFFALLLTAALLAPTAFPAAAAKKSARKRTTRSRVPPPPKVSAAQRASALEDVNTHITEAMETGIQNAAAMVPFYEQLYRLEAARKAGAEAAPLRILHFGDSHIASDDWPNAVRERLQQRFGSGGPGFVHAGRPYAGFRRYDAKGAMSKGWEPQGLLNRQADGLSGLSGVSLTARRAGETITLEATGSRFEIFFLQQPGGGSFTIEEFGAPLDTVSTDGGVGPGFWSRQLPPGPHLLTIRTESSDPVRLHGWSVESPSGATWETLGINGAQADLLLGWNPALLKAHIERRDPALIVLAYGTNEARRPDWTLESYKQALTLVIRLFREAAPSATILIIGAPDQMMRTRRKLSPVDHVSPIVAAQRDAALETGCAFWNLRAAMGGRSSMQQWVRAGLAQGDYVHLTTTGYRLWGQALYELMEGQYGIFQTVRRQYLENNTTANGSPNQNH